MYKKHLKLILDAESLNSAPVDESNEHQFLTQQQKFYSFCFFISIFLELFFKLFGLLGHFLILCARSTTHLVVWRFPVKFLKERNFAGFPCTLLREKWIQVALYFGSRGRRRVAEVLIPLLGATDLPRDERVDRDKHRDWSRMPCFLLWSLYPL